LDYFHTFEGSLVANFGGKGIGWDDPDPNSRGIAGGAATYKTLPLVQGDQWYQRNAWGGQLPNFRRANYWAEQQVSVEPLDPSGRGAPQYLYQITVRNYQPYGNADLAIPPLWYSVEDTSQMALLTTNINTYVEESIAKFVIGDLDPNRDADWNNFQTQLRNLGIERYLQIIQRTYDASAFARR
jgi:putative aldouronate transport system substrate-binding protein